MANIEDIEARLADLERRLRDKRIAYLALSPAERLEQLRGRLAERIAAWDRETAAPPNSPRSIPRNEVLERFVRRDLEIKIMELEGASEGEVAIEAARNIEAAREGRNLSWRGSLNDDDFS